MSRPDVDIRVESRLWERVARAPATVVRAAEAVGAHREAGQAIRHGDEICVTLLDDAAIAALNQTWRGKDGPTNVLSFPAGPRLAPGLPHCLGDVALAFETIEREAKAEEKDFDDHVAHLVVHGVLHLLGYDHLDDGEARRMEALEIGILASIGIADPYAIEAA
jgi:probable rRNA maturation factor